MGTKADKVLTLTMKELLNPNESVEKHKEEATNQLVDRIKNGVREQRGPDGKVLVPGRASAWGTAVLDVTFGDTYSFSREGGKLTIPRDKVDENGVPKTDEGRSLQTAIVQLPTSVKKITLRSAQDQTMRGVFRYAGEGGRGVLEWNDNLAQLSDVQAFLATNGILENARPADEWRRAQGGGWEKVA